MTEQEAKAWAARLTRIWVPEKVRHYSLDGDDDFHWDAFLLRRTIHLFVTVYADDTEAPTFHLSCNRREEFAASLSLSDEEEGDIEVFVSPTKNGVLREFMQRFLSHWTPLFRRGCWLSGCPVEASAHEKAEWIQGFSREEIEEWNLKV